MNNFCDILKEIYLKTAETIVDDYEVNHGIKDEQGVVYSRDGKRLLKATSPETLKEYTIKDSTEIICDGAFYGCSVLSNLIIPSSVKSIGKHILEGCRSLKKLNIPASVTWIASEFLWPCDPERVFEMSVIWHQYSVTIDITIEGNNYTLQDNLLIDNNLHRVVYCLESTKEQVVPEGIVIIEQGAFYHNSPYESLILPTTLKVIRSKAFEGYKLPILDLSDAVEIIENNAFRYAENLAIVKFPENIRILKKEVFYGCKNLTEIRLPKRIEVIDDGCFQSCPITHIKIPKSVRIMGKHVFRGSQIEEIVFEGVPQLMDNEMVEGYSENLKVIIPDGSRPAFERSFLNYAKHMYYKCELEAEENLAEVDSEKTIKDENGIIYSEDGRRVLFISEPYKSVGFNDFNRECPSELIIKEGVEIIGKNAFRDCQSLNRIILPSTLLAIGPNAFENCNHLSVVNFGNQLLSLGSSAFRCCSSLQKVELPSSLTTIRERAFELCSQLADVRISNSVSYIGFGGFMGCARALEHLVLPTSLLEISDYTFHECCVLKYIKLPPSLKEIGKNAFGACLQLESLCIPDSVESINDKAFFRCLNLSHVDFPSSLDFIGDYAFEQCNSLESVTLPPINDILCHAIFSYCDNLKSVIIPEEIDFIQDDIFRGSDIENFYIQGDKFLWDGKRLFDTLNRNIVYERPLNS